MRSVSVWVLVVMLLALALGATPEERVREPWDCECPEVWEPVCGVDVVTYGNKCQLDCVEQKLLHAGECDEDDYETLGGHDGNPSF
jgi:hypothetical protein